MKFDFIIQNPPYSGSFHTDFLNKFIYLSGKHTIIEPATWLINIRKNGKAGKIYNLIKDKLNKHVYKVIIENYNKEFNIGLYVPCSITYIDMDKTYDKIEFICFGYKQYVDSLYDCNLIGNYHTIWSIFNKVLTYKEHMSDHVYKVNKSIIENNTWFTKYAEIISIAGLVFSFPKGGSSYDKDIYYCKTPHGIFLSGFLSALYHTNENYISKTVLKSFDSGKHLTDKNADCLYDTKEHLENWKYFSYNNKLPLFLNVCLIINLHNISKEFIPWIVDKQYTDDEINKLFNFTDTEIKFIDMTIKKFDRYSPWFHRYMEGSNAETDKNVQNFMNSLC